jgi:hypothetical protein
VIEEVRLAQEEDGILIDFRWAPGHENIEGNEIAGEVAKEAAKNRNSYIPQSERFTSVAHLNSRITEEKHEQSWEWLEEKCRGRTNYLPLNQRQRHGPCGFKVQEGAGSAVLPAENRPRCDISIGTHLKRIGRVETEACWWCRANRHTRHHLFFNCPNGGNREKECSLP